MQIIKSIKLNPSTIAKIREFSPVRKFSVTSPLFYEGQVPIVAYLVIAGRISLFKNKKVKNIVKEGNLIGVNELMTNSPSKMNAEVSADSSLCFLDKSTMLEIMNFEKSELSNLFLKMTEIQS
jgi:CRP-like cAMP-binding protein